MKLVTIAALSLVLGVTNAQAQMNLSWSDCGAAGTEHRFFGCETNEGPAYTLVASFQHPNPDQEIQLIGLSAQLQLIASSPNTPDWWTFGTGGCRATSLSVSSDFTGGPFTCVDPWFGQAAGGFVWEVMSPNRARIRYQTAIPHPEFYVLEPNVEYYAFKVSIRRNRTTGPDACVGCDAAQCVFLEEIQLFQTPDRANDPTLWSPIERNSAVWQNGFGGWGHGGYYCVDGPPTSARASTWGAIRSLYR